MKLEFTDGVSFDTSGEYRIETRADGQYVVGRGLLIPVVSDREATELLAGLKGKRKPTQLSNG